MADKTPAWDKIRAAHEQLVAQFLHHPDVSLIDIGYESENQAQSQPIALLIHVRRPEATQTLGAPDNINGIPVRIMVEDFRLE
jgi:hypothetical protein